MKTCPVCKTTYDDPEMLFCINDGTTLVEVQIHAENLPNNSQTANEAAKQPGAFVVSIPQPQQTKVSPAALPPTNVRAKQNSNKFLFPLLAVLLLFAGAAIGAGLYYLSNANREVARSNTNAATKVNASLINNNSAANFNSNANIPLNANVNQNVNAKSSPKPSPSIANRSQNGNFNVNANQIIEINTANANLANVQPSPHASSSPVADASSPQPSRPLIVSGGVLNGRATSLPKPAYPPPARAVRASGAVTVQVTIDEDGNVISAAAISGNPLLREAAVQAARQARFQPTILSGQPVKTSGVINYNFVSEP